MIGASIAHYRITAKLGEGGMGEVYRATDERLGRDVAIKLLPESFSEDPARLARFQREAQLLASLNHPNIGQVYGLEEQDGRSALVLELIEGETLAERMAPGAVPAEDAARIAQQIALALQAAHEKGIVHRDLKPANVKITPDGKVKVLDFGLAKALDPNDPERQSSPHHSPTLTAQATAAGVIMGTAAYMSPEQAKGEAVDKRADIWAFGVVLTEMLTGRRLFDGPTAPETLAQVLTSTPDVAAVPAQTPAALRRLLRRCLARDANQRLHDIADARIVLDEVIAGVVDEPLTASTAAEAPAPPQRRRVLPWLAALAVVAIVSALLGDFLSRPREAEPPEPMHLAIQLAANRELNTSGNSVLAFSPDGKDLVFSGSEDGRRILFRRTLGRREAEVIPGTEEGDAPFFSPDGQWIGFTAGGQLMKVAAEGGRPFQLAEARGAGGATWMQDDTVVFAPMYSDGLFRVAADGGEPERLTTPEREDGVLGHWWPQPLPGERHVVFTAFRTPVDRSRVGVLDLDTREIDWVVEGGFFGRYVSTGHLLYGKGLRVYALPFDPASATAQGPAVPVLDDVRTSQTSGYSQVTVSSRGTLAYITESLGNPVRELTWFDRDGRPTPATTERRRFLSVDLSPDDRQAALTIRGDSRDLWTLSLARATLSRLTSGEDTEFDPRWSADGRELYYIVDSPPFELHRIATGSPDLGRPLFDEPTELDTTTPDVSPDGRTIAFVVSEAQTGENLYVRPLDGSEPPRAIRASRAQESYPSFSPDGRFLAYHSDETGRFEVYVEAVAGGGDRVQVSSDGGSEPLWAANGEIFYRRHDELRVVSTRLGQRFEFDAPRELFRLSLPEGSGLTSRVFDVTADGKRILAVTTPETSMPRQIEVVTDWARELRRLAPAGS
jgi:serine/threonine-protein kinase